MLPRPSFEFHVSRAARDRYGFDDALFSLTGNAVVADLAASRRFARLMNEARDAARHPERAVHAGALNAMGLIDEVLHLVLALYREQRDPHAITDVLALLEARLGNAALHKLLVSFAGEFPTVAVYRGRQKAAAWLEGSTGGLPNRAIALEELLLLWLANVNPAFRPFSELFDDRHLAAATPYKELGRLLREYFETRARFGPENQNLIDLLRAPALASPDSLGGQLDFLSERWRTLLGDFLERLALAVGVLQEEELVLRMRFRPPGWQAGDSSVAAVPHFAGAEQEYERFSSDLEWMPRTVMIAKSAHVWLDQLSRHYGRIINRLDQIPGEELDVLARRGFNALWIIGVWERSRASQRIKQLTGNPEAAASAYSLRDYVVAHDLGGDAAYQILRERASERGIRLASDMVPNHMGIDSRWMIEHPDWFVSLPSPPFPAYTFHGADISEDERVEIKIEDHYYDRSDAAVVFRRRDRWTGDARYVYHGNDGTSFPWNDTAQLNYLKPEVREGVIQTILHVARQFPIIRFDAAMTLTKRHYQRLWFPEPGTGSAIASRAEHGLSKAQFDAAMPQEFWREVVDRVAAEAPGTLLLAEAFWLLEGYFVRTLGMHRVYNSAFMNMLRDEENANYRSVIRNTLEFDPEVLKRYVNFMSNPDERTAVDQFGKGDKYFGVCTLLATMPGLPMFGHGQIEGYGERYGMEYRRSYHDETPDSWLVARHEREIAPLLHRRALFAEVHDFLLYDFFSNEGFVNEDVFAYSNRRGGDRALVVYHNRYADAHGWIRLSCGYSEKGPGGHKHLRQRSLGEAFGLSDDGSYYVACRDSVSGLEFLHRASEVLHKGLRLDLGAYRYHVFLDWRDVRDDGIRPWGALCDRLAGRGVASLDDALRLLELEPVHHALAALLDSAVADELAASAAGGKTKKDQDRRFAVVEMAAARLSGVLVQARSATAAGQAIGASPRAWTGDLGVATAHFKQRLNACLQLASVQAGFMNPWPTSATSVLPSSTGPAAAQGPAWITVLAWSALEAMGSLLSPASPEHAAEQLLEALRLREPIAAALSAYGLPAEARWQAAARVRAAFAHAAWAPGFEPAPGHSSASFGWLHDPDVAWLIGAHDHEGVRYFVQEPYEQLLWWMALPALLDLAADPKPEAQRIRGLEEQLRKRTQAAREAGYRVEALLDSAR